MNNNLKEPLLINSGTDSGRPSLDPDEELPPLVSRFTVHSPTEKLSPRDMMRNTVELLSEEVDRSQIPTQIH